MTILLDPSNEAQPSQRQGLPRPQSLVGKRIALLDISKPRGDIFLDQLEAKLGSLGVAAQRYQKPTFARVAPAELRQRISDECDLVIEALAD